MDWLADAPMHWVLLAVFILGGTLLFLRAYPGRKSPSAIAVADNVQVLLTVIVGVFLIIRPLLFQAFYIPSGSMEPTLLGPQGSEGARIAKGAGDRLIVDKLVYRVSDPHRNDIAVFKAPKAANPEEKDFIKRVIGEPGDTVEVVPTRIVVDGKPAFTMSDGWQAPQKPVPAEPFSVDGKTFDYEGSLVRILVREDPNVQFKQNRVEVDGKVELDGRDGHIERGDDDINPALGGSTIDAELFRVDGALRLIVIKAREAKCDPGHVLINGKRLAEPYIAEAPNYEMAPLQLGPDQYLMLGDNRNQSSDGHVWGSVTRDRFIGRAEILFWPPNRFRVIEWWLILVLTAAWVAWTVIRSFWVSRRPHGPTGVQAETPAAPAPEPMASPTTAFEPEA